MLASIEYSRREGVVRLYSDDGQVLEAPLADFEADPLPFKAALVSVTDARAAKLSDLAALRWETTCSMVFNGSVVASNKDAGESLTHIGSLIANTLQTITAMQALGMVPPATINWKLSDGVWQAFTPAQLQALGLAIFAHVQKCFDNEAALSAQVEAALTSADVARLDVTKGWPATKVTEVTP